MKKYSIGIIRKTLTIGFGIVSGIAFSNFSSVNVQSAEVLKASSGLEITWSASSSDAVKGSVLRQWPIHELSRHALTRTSEKDPVTGVKISWRGILLSKLVDEALVPLSVEDRAQFDLVVLQGKSGETAFIPRALIAKYPIILALLDEAKKRGPNADRGPIYSIVPWTSRPRIMNEDLPVENFFVPNVVRVELANYAARYGSMFLKRRTDPSAIRGEKIFVQSCTGCHLLQQNSSLLQIAQQEHTKRYFMGQHPDLKGVVRLSEKSRRSIARYLDAYRAENGLSVSSVTSPRQIGSN